MTHQSSGKAPNGLPSLYDEVADADTTDKSLSILSAVTGREVAKPSGQKKMVTLRRVVPLFMLLIVGMLGFTYWQNSGGEFEAKLATSASPSSINTNIQRPTLAITLPTVTRQETPAKAAVHTDAAIIETVKDSPAVVPPGNSSLQSDLKTPEATKTLPVERPAIKVDTPKSLAMARALPIKEKNTVKRKVAEQNSNPKVAKVPTPQATPAKPQPSQRNTVSVAQADPDEKLLEGMLRLMKRDPPKDTTHMRSAR